MISEDPNLDKKDRSKGLGKKGGGSVVRGGVDPRKGGRGKGFLGFEFFLFRLNGFLSRSG